MVRNVIRGKDFMSVIKKVSLLLVVNLVIGLFAPISTGIGSQVIYASTQSQRLHSKMLSWDKKFDKLSKINKAVFIRYWTDYYTKKHGVSKKKIYGSKAVGISIKETSLGRAGVGRTKNNLFGCKVSPSGKFYSKYPKYKYHRSSVEGIVMFYKKFGEWRLWRNAYSSIGIKTYNNLR